MPNSALHKRMTCLLTSLGSYVFKEHQPLLNKLKPLNLKRLCSNVFITLRLFLTLPATVATAGIPLKLSIETEISEKLDYSSIIDPFTGAKNYFVN